MHSTADILGRHILRTIWSGWVLVIGYTLNPTGTAVAEVPQGAIVAWGYNGYGQLNVPAPNADFIAVAAGEMHSLGLKADGSVVAWGSDSPHDDHGQCNVPAPNTDFIAIAAGWYHSVGLKADGTIVTWGSNFHGETNLPAPNTGFVDIAAGEFHNLGLKSDGSIVAWGNNSNGQTDVPAPNSGFVAVAGGVFHSLALKADGTIVAWGYNFSGQTDVPAPNADFSAVAAGSGAEHNSLGLKADGSIVAWGCADPLNFGQCDVPAPNAEFVAVAAGYEHSLGLKADGSVVAWGCGLPAVDYGQCNVPISNSDFRAIATGLYHSLAVKKRIGACCDLLAGNCFETVEARDCSGTHQAWTASATCANVVCNAVTGACCNHDPSGACTDGVTREVCDCPTCEWLELSPCSDVDCLPASIPTVGGWGLLTLALVLLIGTKLAMRRPTGAPFSPPHG